VSDGHDDIRSPYAVTLPWLVRVRYVPWRWLVFVTFTLRRQYFPRDGERVAFAAQAWTMAHANLRPLRRL
jgi:hypothetical protein